MKMVGGFDDPSVEAEHRAQFEERFANAASAGDFAGRTLVWLIAFLIACAAVVVGAFAAALTWHLIRIGWGLA